jgi:hypothetical protein
MADDCSGAQHEPLAQSFVAGSADATQALFAAGRTFERHQTQPGGEVSTRLELRGIDTQAAVKSADRAEAGHGRQALTFAVGLVLHGQLRVDLSQSRFQPINLIAHQ